ncbi:MAG TPA: GAF domain-containing protein [Mycobacteriales bacterium]|nr:GAF domain-containing protein [Mycobacteriales bacterium]
MSTEALTQALAEMATLYDATAPALTPPSSRTLLEALVRTAQRSFAAQACSLALLSRDETELVFTVTSGRGADVIGEMRMPAGRGIAGYVLASGEAIAVRQPSRDPRWASDIADRTGYTPDSILAAPVAYDEHVFGVLEVLDRDDTRGSAQDDLTLLQQIADQAAIALGTLLLFSHAGRNLLAAAGAAVRDGGPLAVALQQAAADAAPADRDVLSLAALLGELAHRSPADVRLATAVVRAVLDERRGSS